MSITLSGVGLAVCAVVGTLVAPLPVAQMVALQIFATCVCAVGMAREVVTIDASPISLRHPLLYWVGSYLCLPWVFFSIFLVISWISLPYETRRNLFQSISNAEQGLGSLPVAPENLYKLPVANKVMEALKRYTSSVMTVALKGPVGTGKTTCLTTALENLFPDPEERRRHVFMARPCLYSTQDYLPKLLEALLKAAKGDSKKQAPWVLVLPEFDQYFNSEFVPKTVTQGGVLALEEWVAHQLPQDVYVHIVAVSNNWSACTDQVKDLFETQVSFDPFSRKERMKILQHFYADGTAIGDETDDLVECAKATENVPIGHLKTIAQKAKREEMSFTEAQRALPQPAHCEKPTLQVYRSGDQKKLTPGDIVGPLQGQVIECIARINQGRAPRGMILHGPPGTGKTRTAHVIADSIPNSVFIAVEPARLRSSYHGESGKLIKDTFAGAREVARERDEALRREWIAEGSQGDCPRCTAVVWWDELDSLGDRAAEGRRPGGGGASWATREMVTTLLEQLDGFHHSNNLFFIGATNHLEGLDRALLDRLSLHIETYLPDSTARQELLGYLLSDKNHDLTHTQMHQLAEECMNGRSYRVITDLVAEAQWKSEFYNHSLCMADFTEALKTMAVAHI